VVLGVLVALVAAVALEVPETELDGTVEVAVVAVVVAVVAAATLDAGGRAAMKAARPAAPNRLATAVTMRARRAG
jgi:hypothetical protein